MHHAPQRMVFNASPRWLPTSAQSPGTPPPFPRGRWRSGDPPNRREQNSITAIERALAALEPEDVSVKEGLEAVLRRAKDKAKAATPSRAPVPEVTFEAARVKVVKLEAALAALSACAGPEVDALREALARAKVAASPATSGHSVEAMPTVHRLDCEAHRRFGQISRVESVRLGTVCNVSNRKPQFQFHLQLWRQMLRQKWCACRILFHSCRHSWQSPKAELWRW